MNKIHVFNSLIKVGASFVRLFKDFLLLVPTAVILLYVHYRVCASSSVDIMNLSIVHIVMSATFDTLLLTLLSFAVTGWRKVTAVVVATIVSLAWGIANIIYATYFHAYIPFSALGQVSGMRNLSLGTYVINAVQYSDLIFLLIIVSLFCILRGRWIKFSENRKCFVLQLVVPLSVLSMMFAGGKICQQDGKVVFPNRVTIRQASLMPTRKRLGVLPMGTITEYGVFRAVVLPKLFMSGLGRQLEEQQRTKIDGFIMERDTMYSDTSVSEIMSARKDIILILAESYLSDTRDKIYGGKEVTPFLDSVRCEVGTICNDSVYPNVTIGNSSDGQFMYMTGLLPHRSDLTVSFFPGFTVISLAHILKSLSYKTLMTIPTESQMWNQQEVCKAYAIDSLYSIEQLQKNDWISDGGLFDYALRNEGKNGSPLFHIILTSTTHGPYDELKEECGYCKCCPQKFPVEFTQDYVNYLKACHYMDHCIQRYVMNRRDAVIIIASDHGWAENKALLPKSVDGDKISFMVLNSGYQGEYYKGKINQVDVFTSVMDLLQPYADNRRYKKVHWYGVGRSILRSKGWEPSVTDDIWEMSTDMLEGNYFNDKIGSR